MSDGWDCRRLHHHDTRDEADECDTALTTEAGSEGESETPTLARSASYQRREKSDPASTPPDEPIVSPEEHAAAVAEARRRLEEGRRK